MKNLILKEEYFRTAKKKSAILIIGASLGMWKATAELLLKEGYIVYGATRHIGKMKDIESKGANL